ncbi:MAG: response regulator transcription factor [Bacteroidetes bacterium]|nr:response regulator transcription factor [Bacteroidota bacterium]
MISIAIIEDDEDIRESLKILIQTTEGFECAGTFADAETGLEFLTGNPADIVLMDIQLPGMNGIECVRQLKSIHPEMQFIMCTIFQNDDSVFNALKAGATGYLLKTDDPGKIIDAIHELHAGGSPMTPQIARRVMESFKIPTVNDAIHLLTKRETEMLGLLAKGFRYKEIADKLFISTETVRKHINNIYQKLHVQSRIEAVNKIFGERS